MHLGRSIWRAALPAAKPAAASRSAARRAPPLDFAAAAAEIGILPRLERKPWVVLGDLREDFETYFGLPTDVVISELSHWFTTVNGGGPAAVGLAHVSGNVYFGPAIKHKVASLSPEQVIVANIFSHGEIGLDLVAAHELPKPESGELLREMATFKRMRWLDVAQLPKVEAVSGTLRNRDPGSVIRPARASLLKRHPLMTELLEKEVVGDASTFGKCLQHSNFGHLDIVGESIEELQVSLAENSAARSYSPLGDLRMGCAVRVVSGMLFAGHFIGSRSCGSSISPLQSALVSLGANGLAADDVASVVWAASESQEGARLEAQDRMLLQELAPKAAFLRGPPPADVE